MKDDSPTKYGLLRRATRSLRDALPPSSHAAGPLPASSPPRCNVVAEAGFLIRHPEAKLSVLAYAEQHVVYNALSHRAPAPSHWVNAHNMGRWRF